MLSDVTVDVNGFPCVASSVSTTQIVCTTSPRSAIREPALSVTFASLGATVRNATVRFRYLDRWSALSTWGGGPLPKSGDSVVIPYGQSVLLDVSPPRLYLLLVQGELIFDRRDLNLNATYIFVMGGRTLAAMLFGKEGCRFALGA